MYNDRVEHVLDKAGGISALRTEVTDHMDVFADMDDARRTLDSANKGEIELSDHQELQLALRIGVGLKFVGACERKLETGT